MKAMLYLNTASTGVPSQPVVEAMNDYMIRRSEGRWGYTDTDSLYSDVKVSLSKLLGGEPSDYAFMPSTSIGMNSFGHAISYPDQANIVICDLEFPSNFLPWQNIEKLYNVELRVVESVDGAAPLEDFTRAIDENTRVVAISHVQFGSGYRSNLKALADAVHEYDGFLVADIIQSAGWADFNLVDQDVDFAAGQATKWISGPIGAGYAYVSPKVREVLQPRFIGWHSVKNHRDFTYGAREFRDDAGMLEGGSPPLVAYAGFRKALDLLQTLPDEVRVSTALNNATYLKQRLDEVGLQYYDFDEEHSSPIVSCKYDRAEQVEIELRKQRVFCSARHGRLRISPSFYNTTDEIDTFVEIIDKLQ